MDTDDIKRLEWHAGLDPRVATEGLEGTFASMLRPFSGLKLETLAEVHELAERVLSAKPDPILRLRSVAAVLELTTLARYWALDPGSMLVRNRLLGSEDAKRLHAWTRAMEEIAKRLCEESQPAGDE